MPQFLAQESGREEEEQEEEGEGGGKSGGQQLFHWSNLAYLAKIMSNV